MGKRYEPELKQNVDINEKVHIYIKPFDHIKMNLIICFNVVILKKKKKAVPSSTYNLWRNSHKTLLYEPHIQTQICSNTGPQHI